MKVTAAILAGGKGTRFVPHKGLLNLNGETIIERQIRELKSVFDDLIIITNSLERYKALGVRLFSDIALDKGPLGGIYSALINSDGQYNFLIASDMPHVNTLLIEYMRNYIKDYDVVVPEFRRKLEPLYAFYSKSCISSIKRQFEKNNFKLTDFLTGVKIKKIKHDEVSHFDPQGLSFANINTEKDYEKFKGEE